MVVVAAGGGTASAVSGRWVGQSGGAVEAGGEGGGRWGGAWRKHAVEEVAINEVACEEDRDVDGLRATRLCSRETLFQTVFPVLVVLLFSRRFATLD
jgi:hypothetical protein